MKVALVIGRYEPGHCGVGDYTVCLARALNAAEVDAEVISAGHPAIGRALPTGRELRRAGFDLIHLQYPTAGFGKNLGPQALALLNRCVVTIHEASQRHLLRKLSLLPFALRYHHLIFTSAAERSFASKWVPWILNRSSVIPVASNIPVGATSKSRSMTAVVHFGLLIPNKGLEDVMELARAAKRTRTPVSIQIVGGTVAAHSAYVEHLQRQSADLPVVWHVAATPEQIGEMLAQARFAYFPFPDGASERRTTLKAALLNGAVVLTTAGAHTPADLAAVVHTVQGPDHALARIRALMEQPHDCEQLSRRAVAYARQFSFEEIARLHIGVYESIARHSNHELSESVRTHSITTRVS